MFFAIYRHAFSGYKTLFFQHFQHIFCGAKIDNAHVAASKIKIFSDSKILLWGNLLSRTNLFDSRMDYLAFLADCVKRFADCML